MAPGTQPNPDTNEFRGIVSSANCMFCHADYGLETPPYDTWVVSLMAQSARDPVFHAAFTIANQDADKAGSFCIRCHVPAAHYNGNGDTSEIPEFDIELMDGINCHFCHRVVNPAGGAMGYEGELDDPDSPILADLAAAGHFPVSVGNGQIIVDPDDVRRGPYDDVPANYHGYDQDGQVVRIITSPFHRDSTFCGGCHDVSNPVFVLDEATGKGVVSEMGTEHPTHDVYDMVAGAADLLGVAQQRLRRRRRGLRGRPLRRRPSRTTPRSPAARTATCPRRSAAHAGSTTGPPFFERPDVGAHAFAGGNTWVLDADRRSGGRRRGLLRPHRRIAARPPTREPSRCSGTPATWSSPSKATNSERSGSSTRAGTRSPPAIREGRRMWLNVQLPRRRPARPHRRSGAPTTSTPPSSHDHRHQGLREDDGHLRPTSPSSPTCRPASRPTSPLNNESPLRQPHSPPRLHQREAYAAFGGGSQGRRLRRRPVLGRHHLRHPRGRRRKPSPPCTSRPVLPRVHGVPPRRQRHRRSSGQDAYDLWVSHGKSAPLAMDVMTHRTSRRRRPRRPQWRRHRLRRRRRHPARPVGPLPRRLHRRLQRRRQSSTVPTSASCSPTGSAADIRRTSECPTPRHVDERMNTPDRSRADPIRPLRISVGPLTGCRRVDGPSS